MIVYFFIMLAVLAIGSALAMVINKNVVNSALFLVLNMVSLAGIFLILNAQFLAVIQILVYAGAIMVLFLFVIMLLNVEDEEKLFDKFRVKYLLTFLLAMVVMGQIFYSLAGVTDMLPQISGQMATIGTVEAVGDVLYTDYLLPFEMTAVLLTAAVVGALMIAQHKIKRTDEI
ncbi:MAG: NADH-quinone oxidoreductase subunit J [Gracilimonas sp.]|uniref:NADH-quinone oxidoreductase subunit J family protein n=2 Tax=Balneolaceae TaxID=1813606 RepID=UPI001B2E2E8C|nr:NADH-quinone oxidoreductase subunit J [Gracilimonas sp.]MBO6585886.1 NADH-quinone oxidoreductase subunit J [Gracilimonas sp.]MBO6616883.1 NADH-quinone oxidoreductase subunit J [Gracilimonas sp.]